MPCIARFSVFHFNSRPHKEVDKDDRVLVSIDGVFQFTTSQGGRL